VGLGLVLLNVKHGTAPTMRDRALEQRAGQAAEGFNRTGETRAPDAATQLGREATRDDAGRAAPPAIQAPGAAARPSAGAPSASAPSAGVTQKQEAPPGRAYRAQSTPSGENERPPRPAQGFAKAPPPAPGEQGAVQKPRYAQPLEESRTKAEANVPPAGAMESAPPASAKAGASPADAKKDEDRARRQNVYEFQAPTKSAAPAPTASLPPPPGAPPAGAAAGTESGARPTPALVAEPQSKLRAEPAAHRICGTVKDSRGRPIPSASVTLATQGSGVSSDAEGRFCLDSPPGEQTLAVMAVGFAPLRIDVNAAPGAPPLSLTLIAISVIEESSALRANLRTLGGHAQTGAPGAPGASFAGFPDSLQSAAGRAVRLTLEAERTKSAPRYEAAAVEWEKVRERSADPPLVLEARFRIAEARYRAWELAPTPKRVAAANEALTSYLVRAPLGARRDTASAWLGRVKP
jgi:hypothetical protein